MGETPGWLQGHFEVDELTGCWLWTGTLFSTGYAQVRLKGEQPQQGHRLAYEAIVGTIPDGYQIDHVYARGCRHKRCVNPEHLEPVTPAENTRRYHDSRTSCRNGHPRTNLYVDGQGKRRCRACRRAAHQRWLAANPARYRELRSASQKRTRAARKAN